MSDQNSSPSILAKPWERQEEESDKAWEAFCAYLELPKRDGTNRRFQQDLAVQLGCTISNINRWYNAWDWEERAKARDTFLAEHPQQVAELAIRRQFASEIRTTGSNFRELAERAIEQLSDYGLDAQDAIRLYKLGVDLEEKAARIEQPAVKKQVERLDDSIRELVNQLARGVGKLASGTQGGTLSATERKISLEFDGGRSDGEPVAALPAIPREICTADFRSDVVERADGDSPCGEGLS